MGWKDFMKKIIKKSYETKNESLEEAVDKYVVLKQTVELNNGKITGYGKEVIRS